MTTVAGTHTSVPDRPNALRSGLSLLWAMRVRRPRPVGSGRFDHAPLASLLAAVRAEGTAALVTELDALQGYLDGLAQCDPDELDRHEALAYWINLYNAGSMRLAAEAQRRALPTLLRLPDGFDRPFIAVAGERLSLDDIEHGKIRRFGDPRVHGALNCCSRSCPLLRSEPYGGRNLDTQLDEQLRRFLAAGGIRLEPEPQRVTLSRIFQWFGSDFVRPQLMPALYPVPSRAVLAALHGWLEPEVVTWLEQGPLQIRYQPYDWSLLCAVAPPGT